MTDDFDAFDSGVWVPHYLPHWSSRAESAATYPQAGSVLRLSIPPEQGLWCAGDHVPPLRVRKPDIMLLADHFLAKYSVEHGKHIKRIATPAIDMLTSYHWPGNVRELENTIERAVLVCEGNVIHGHHLPPTLQTAEASGTLPRTSLEDTVATFERDLIQDALKSTRGNRARAARLLQTTERILGYKVRKYGIDCARFGT